MYKVWYPNFGFYLEPEFNTIQEAISYGISKGFQFLIVNSLNGEIEYQSPSIVY